MRTAAEGRAGAAALATMVVASMAAVATAAPKPDQLAADVAKQALAGHLPGVAIAIVQDGKTVFSGGFGKAELENDIAVTDDTVFRINSITKAFTATLILQLAEAGKLSIDDHLSKYFPEYTQPGFDPTLAQLLSHASGMASYHGALFRDNIAKDLTAKEWVDSVAKQKLYLSKPGTTWYYSNAAYDVLGMLAVRLGGMDLAALFKKRIFDPAGMTHTQLCDDRAVIAHRARSYAWVKEHFEPAKSWGTYGEASAGLCSTTGDLVHFVQALDSGKLLGPRSLARMRTPATLSGGVKYDYGFGTRFGHIASARVVAYSGDGEEWSSTVVTIPERKLIVIALANADLPNWAAIRVATTIASGLLGASDKLLDLDVPSPLAAKLRAHADPSVPDSADIGLEDKHIVVQPVGGPKIRLYYQGGTTFRFGPDSIDPIIEVVFDTRRTPPIAVQYRGGVFVQLLMQSPANTP